MLKVGDKFESYENFNKQLQKYKNEVFNDYWIRDSRTIETQAKRYPESVAAQAKQDLIYHYVRIACIKGGRMHTPRNKTKNTFTFRQKCPAGMFLKLSSCGNFLEIKELNEDHNHPVSQTLFKSLPQQRLNISNQLKVNSVAALQARANKKIVQNNIINESGCLVTLKDLTNLNRKPQNRIKFDECVSILRNTYKCDVHINVDVEANLKCLYFQDPEMKHMFDSYPEIIFVDGTYCLHSSRAATYLIMVEDAEGSGAIVAVGILLNETQENIDWFIKTFKNLNQRTSDIKVVMSDKDNKERNVFKENFPDASLQICLFHTLQIFNREVSVKKMGLSTTECEVAKKYLQNLAYASSEECFQKTYLEMKQNVPEVVIDYFEKNWEPIKDEWVLYLTFANLSFLNKTNNRIESINAKLKSVITKFSNLEDFIKNFFVILNSSRADRNIKNSKEYHKVTTRAFTSGSAEDLYSRLLTNFAFKKVQQQLECMTKCKDFQFIEEEKCLAPTSEGLLEVTPHSCQCMFWTSVQLPCRHIFKLRSMCNQSLFDENICLKRWKRTYFESRHPFFSSLKTSQFEETPNTNSELEVNLEVTDDNPYKRRPLTNHQKFKIMNDECLRLSQICSEVSSKTFYNRLKFIKSLVTEWSNNSYKSTEDNTNGEIEIDNPSSFPSNDDNEAEKETENQSSPKMHMNRKNFENNNNDNSTSQLLNQILDTSSRYWEIDQNCAIDIIKVHNDVMSDVEDGENTDNNMNNMQFNACQSSNSVCWDVDRNCAINIINLSKNPSTQDNQSDESSSKSKAIIISDVKIPTVKIRGRPKGRGNTVIGLKKKKNI